MQALSSLRSQENLDELLRQRGSSARWQTLHPKASAPGPQETAPLAQIRMSLEASKHWLGMLRFTLASALFAGIPEGARAVLCRASMPGTGIAD